MRLPDGKFWMAILMELVRAAFKAILDYLMGNLPQGW